MIDGWKVGARSPTIMEVDALLDLFKRIYNPPAQREWVAKGAEKMIPDPGLGNVGDLAKVDEAQRLPVLQQQDVARMRVCIEAPILRRKPLLVSEARHPRNMLKANYGLLVCQVYSQGSRTKLECGQAYECEGIASMKNSKSSFGISSPPGMQACERV